MNRLVICFFLGILSFSVLKAIISYEKNVQYCSVNHRFVIGVVIDQSSRVGKEQRIAVEMAVHDLNRGSKCSKLDLHFQDSLRNSAQAVSSVSELVNKKQAHAILGQLTFQEATLLWDLDKVPKDIPIITIAPISSSPPLLPSQPPAFIRMSSDISVEMQCIASIVGYFKWRKVIAIYEHSKRFSADSGLVTYLSDSLQAVESVVEHHIAFPHVGSQSNPKKIIEQELSKLRSKSIKVFVVLQSSLDFAIILFKKAKELGMMGKGYVWIVSDDVASLLDSVESSILMNFMQGVIGLKTNYLDNSYPFKPFELQFRRKYRLEYPDEETYSSPSIYALRAYDATWAVAKGIQNSKGNVHNNIDLVSSILSCNFEGLSGNISFKNGALFQKPIYQFVNVVGKSYRLISLWSPEYGFSENRPFEDNGAKMKFGNDTIGDLSSIHWPGGELTPPKGWTVGSMEKPLKIGVPGNGSFHQFVNVSLDQSRNKTISTGFSIQVFEAAVGQLPYHLPYVLVPYYGLYDQLVADVHNKSLDAAVGDIGIVADRYEKADFSQPYLECGIVMVVTVKPDVTKIRFIIYKAFKLKMWVLMAAMNMFTGAIIWLNEHANNNPEFRGPFHHNIGSILWFSVAVLSFAQRESITSNLSRLVLATWLFVTLVVTACFTASVTSMMTVPRIEPSVVDIDYLLGANAPVGCNRNSFVGNFLINVLQFKHDNIRRIDSIDDYPAAFKNGNIKAAFLVAPHAKVFLAKYCKGYTIAGPSYKLGGFGFVFQKGSPLAIDFSEAILKLTLSGTINKMETQMLLSLNCSPSTREYNQGTGEIGIEPFFFLFVVSGCLLAIVFVNAILRLLKKLV